MSYFKAKILVKCTKFWGLRPRPRWGSPSPPSWIQGILLLREGEGGGKAKAGEERGMGRGGVSCVMAVGEVDASNNFHDCLDTIYIHI